MGRRTAGAAAFAVALALVAAGCGSKSSTSTTSATVTWANSLCSAATTFKDTVRNAVSGLKDTPTKAGLQDAMRNVQTATQDFLAGVKTLGAPKTKSGAEAQQELAMMTSTLQDDLATMKSAVGQGSALGAVATVTATLADAKSEVESTIDQLKVLEPKDELQQAFSEASACGQ
jgi:hypothetical protein